LSYQLNAYDTKVLSWAETRKLLPLLSQICTHWQNQMALVRTLTPDVHALS